MSINRPYHKYNEQGYHWTPGFWVSAILSRKDGKKTSEDFHFKQGVEGILKFHACQAQIVLYTDNVKLNPREVDFHYPGISKSVKRKKIFREVTLNQSGRNFYIGVMTTNPRRLRTELLGDYNILDFHTNNPETCRRKK